MKKLLAVFYFILLLISFYYFLKTPIVNAQSTPFPPPVVPCDATENPEFHSLRPYQASPCNDSYSDLALYCGNSLTLADPITITKTFFPETYTFEGVPINPSAEADPTACSYCNSFSMCITKESGCNANTSGCEAGLVCPPVECENNGDGTETCIYNIDRIKDIVIDLEDAFLPIMGFTEPSIGNESNPYKVINSQNQSENLPDVDKVNEYVSWYLNGVNERAEYPPVDAEDEEEVRKIIDFSGPLKKLLSFESQQVKRADEVKRGDKAEERHDQIVGCVNLLQQPTECYPDRAGVNEVRLSYWAEHIPPLRRAYDTYERYIDAYNSWKARYLGSLYKYIPFSSTEDRLGQVEIEKMSIQPPLSSSFRILNSRIIRQSPADLFFSHMEESAELAETLQQTYASQDADLAGSPSRTYSPSVRNCDLKQIRSNPGDDLFATEVSATIEYTAQVTCEFLIPGDPPGNLCRNLTNGAADCVPSEYYCGSTYSPADCQAGTKCGESCDPPPDSSRCRAATQNNLYYCYPNDWGCTGPSYGGSLCDSGYECNTGCEEPPDKKLPTTQACTNTVLYTLNLITKTPKAKEVWSRLVAGPAGVFKRFFPKVEEDENVPVTAIWDIPAATKVTYTSNTPIAYIGSPGNQRSEPELYFKHIGGIHEYFLTAIQTALRPFGYGRQPISGPYQTAQSNPSTECPDAPPAPGDVEPGGGYCQLGTGYCDWTNFTSAFGSERAAKQASIICNVESGGNPSAFNCGCMTGTTVDYSIGLFQINLLAHCPGAFSSYEWKPPSCTVGDQTILDGCMERFFDPQENIEYAAQLAGCGDGTCNWTPWSAYTVACRDEIDAI